jgi:serine/threonine-protein kinase
LRGELDLIAASALRHDPARRYADAGALADDLRRFLAGMPLRAHKDSAAYRARRFVGRHRLVLVVCAAAVLALMATTGFAVRQMQQAHRQAQRAAEVRRFLEDTFRQVGAKGDPQRKLSVSELLDSGVGRLRALPMGPELRAELSKLFGTLYWNIGEYAKAEALIEQAVDTDTGDGVSLQARAAAVAEMAQTEIERAHYGDAHLHALLALELAHRVGTKADEVASDARRELARATIFQGHPDRARAQLLDAIALDRARYGARSGQVADDLIATGTAERKLGHYSAAIADARQAIGILGILPHGSQCRITLAYSSISMAEDLRGDAARAARAARTELARAQANTCNTSRSAIVAHIYLDRALAHQGRYADALRDNQATLALAAPIARLRPEIIADIRASMADDYLGLGQPDEAERQARQSLAQWRKSGSNGHAPVGFPVRRDLASALAAQGHVSDAETILRGLLADQRAIETDDNPDLNWTRVELAKVLAAGHRKDESDRVLQLAREAVRKRDAADTPSRLFAAVEAAPAAHVAPAQAAR